MGAPAGADGLGRRLDVERRRLVAEPRVLPLRELARARQDLRAVVPFPVADRQRGGLRPGRIPLVQTALLLLQPVHEHVVEARGDARADDGAVVTSGGRVLSVTGLGADLRAAVAAAYAGVAKISFDGAFHRSDIAHRAFER